MPTFSKLPLSQTATGGTITVTQSATPGNLIHQTQSLSSVTDEIYLYASNIGTSDSVLTIYWGASGTYDSLGAFNVQAYAGPVLVSPGLILKGDGANVRSIYATSTVLSSINIVGYVNRIA